MQRERLVPLVVALLSVLALAVGAATLDSATSGPVTGRGEGPGLTDDQGERGDLGAPPAAEPTRERFFPTWVAQLLVALLLLAGLVGLSYWIRREGLDFVKAMALTVFALTAFVVVFYYLLQWFTAASTRGGEAGLLGEVRPQLPGGGGEVATVATDPSVVVLVVAALVLLGAVAVLARSATGRADEDPVGPDPDDPDPEVQAVGAAAGRAADRIAATGDVENAVYRAWREMTDPLDLSRETSTPGEFAAAAVDAGMRREDVSELTSLFESTRYGGVAVDEDRERRATTALRRIERTYGETR